MYTWQMTHTVSLIEVFCAEVPVVSVTVPVRSPRVFNIFPDLQEQGPGARSD